MFKLLQGIGVKVIENLRFLSKIGAEAVAFVAIEQTIKTYGLPSETIENDNSDSMNSLAAQSNDSSATTAAAIVTVLLAGAIRYRGKLAVVLRGKGKSNGLTWSVKGPLAGSASMLYRDACGVKAYKVGGTGTVNKYALFFHDFITGKAKLLGTTNAPKAIGAATVCGAAIWSIIESMSPSDQELLSKTISDLVDKVSNELESVDRYYVEPDVVDQLTNPWLTTDNAFENLDFLGSRRSAASTFDALCDFVSSDLREDRRYNVMIRNGLDYRDVVRSNAVMHAKVESILTRHTAQDTSLSMDEIQDELDEISAMYFFTMNKVDYNENVVSTINSLDSYTTPGQDYKPVASNSFDRSNASGDPMAKFMKS